MGREVFSHLQRSRAPSHICVTWKHKWCHSIHAPRSLYPEHDATWSGISLCSVCVTCPGSVPSQPPMHPQIPCHHGVQKAEKALALCELCSAVTETSLHYQPCVQYKSKTAPHQPLSRKLTLPQHNYQRKYTWTNELADTRKECSSKHWQHKGKHSKRKISVQVEMPLNKCDPHLNF